MLCCYLDRRHQFIDGSLGPVMSSNNMELIIYFLTGPVIYYFLYVNIFPFLCFNVLNNICSSHLHVTYVINSMWIGLDYMHSHHQLVCSMHPSVICVDLITLLLLEYLY